MEVEREREEGRERDGGSRPLCPQELSTLGEESERGAQRTEGARKIDARALTSPLGRDLASLSSWEGTSHMRHVAKPEERERER